MKEKKNSKLRPESLMSFRKTEYQTFAIILQFWPSIYILVSQNTISVLTLNTSLFNCHD